MKRVFGLMILASILLPMVGCTVEHHDHEDDDHDTKTLKVKVDD
jgi:hypothetical protein